MSFSEKFVERLKELMQEKELNAKQLAEKTGIHSTFISKWLNFIKNVSIKQLIILSDFFSCSIDYLVVRNENYLLFIPQTLIPFNENIRKIMKDKVIPVMLEI